MGGDARLERKGCQISPSVQAQKGMCEKNSVHWNQPSEHSMNTFAIRIKPSVQAELAVAVTAEARGEFYTAFRHLERAHVLGQATTLEHVRVHWRMFRLALRNRLYGEAGGQLWRLVAASIFTAPGLVPEGNTGGTDVSGFRRLPVPNDLKQTLDAARA
jgi:hypothetical protein